MRRATILTLVVALLLAMTASVAVAKNINGTNGSNNLRGTSGPDRINARAGADEIHAIGGADELLGGSGKDRVFGGNGADTATGGSGDDTVSGGLGGDTLKGGIGNDELEGRDGDDTLLAAGDGERDEAKCGPGSDDYTKVDLNDVVDDQPVESLLDAPGNVLSALSCETIEVVLLDGTTVVLTTDPL